MATIAEAIAVAMRHQQEGRLAEAESIYHQILAADPGHAQAMHLLGTVALQARQFALAIELISAATKIDHSQSAFYTNLGEAYRLSGQIEQAIACNKNALKIQPRSMSAHLNLGHMYLNRAEFRSAIECFREAARIMPDAVAPRIGLGRALKETGDLPEAERSLRRALRSALQDLQVHVTLALMLQAQGKLDDAREILEHARSLAPLDAAICSNLGNVYKELFRPADAEAAYRQAMAADPNLTVVSNNYGALLLDEGRHVEAIALLTSATQLNPNSAEAFCNLSRAYLEVSHPDEALAAAERALDLMPGMPFAYGNLGGSYKVLGRLDESIEAFRQATQRDPQNHGYHGSLNYTLLFHPAYDAATIFSAHRAWAAKHADSLRPALIVHGNDRALGRRLRVGYVSAQFRTHAVNFFTEPILASHDHVACEVFCYDNGSIADESTARLRGYADHWRPIGHLKDEQAAELVRNDRIDVLVDLCGHIGGNRLLLFARQPAPVQVTYLGYQCTTGMPAMNYRLTDDWSDPPGTTEQHYTEVLVRLPRAFFCYQPSHDAPPVAPLPAGANGYVTFGSFNNFAKVTPQVLTTWAELLKATPKSRIVILAGAAKSLAVRVLAAFAEHGIEASRVKVADRCPRDAYLQLINETDIALDPFPFNGHTTTCDALWQGVPVVTLTGQTYAQRFGSSAHQNLGLQDLVASSPQEYVEIAARLAGNTAQLAALRADLRARMKASPLLDFAEFTRTLESAYRQMWTRWCAESADTP